MNFGDQIKTLREKNNLLQRQVASSLDVDTAMLSKIERGDRRAKREYIPILAKLFDYDEKELVNLWLADQVFDLLKNEPNAMDVLTSVSKSINTTNKQD
ncbi:MAG: helix-turn-helix transcriptional regulator [Flavobacteriia bacterium]|nr:helix-turn-helix transcriptional regulator [Flavobacteriia bacterium]